MDDSLLDIISNLSPLAQNIIYALIAVGALWALWDKTLGRMWRWGMFKLWPGREGWGADCIPRGKGQMDDVRLEPNRAWQLGAGERWCQMREMRVDDYYKLDIAKPRVISQVKLVCKENSYPEEFQLQIKENDEKGWEIVKHYDSKDGSVGSMNVVFDKPRKLKGLNFIITKPRLEPKSEDGKSPAWSIFDIRLTEMRLFGHFWKRVIER